jgi:hypothetical protein
MIDDIVYICKSYIASLPVFILQNVMSKSGVLQFRSFVLLYHIFSFAGSSVSRRDYIYAVIRGNVSPVPRLE